MIAKYDFINSFIKLNKIYKYILIQSMKTIHVTCILYKRVFLVGGFFFFYARMPSSILV